MLDDFTLAVWTVGAAGIGKEVERKGILTVAAPGLVYFFVSSFGGTGAIFKVDYSEWELRGGEESGLINKIR